MFDLHNNVSPVLSIVPKVVNDDTEGTGVAVDLQGFGAAEVLFLVGDSGDTLSGSVSLQCKIQDSDDGSTGWADVTGDDLLGSASIIDAPAEDQVVQALGYLGSKRFIRAIVDTTGTHTNGTPIGAVVVRGRGRHRGGQAV